MILPLDTGFAGPDIELLTEQDILGDRLVRRRKRKKDADAFLAELSALERGDLVVHTDHGIGKYLGLEPVSAGKSLHDCVMLEYRGGDKLYIPVENIDVLTRYGSSEEAVMLDRLGGEAWQRRRAQLKERIRAIAGDLMKVAAARALRQAPVLAADGDSYNQFVDQFPWDETDDQERAIADVLRDLESGRPMDRLVCGDVGFGKTEVALRAAFVAAMNGQQVAMVAPTTLLARQHYSNFVRTVRRLSAQGRASVAPRPGKGNEGHARSPDRRHDGHRHRHACDPVENHRVRQSGPGHRGRGTTVRRHA